METEELAEAEQRRFAELSVECTRVGRRIRTEQDRLEALVRRQVSPSLGLIEELTTEIGIRRQTLAVVRENERHLAELKSEAEGVREAQREVERLRDLIRSFKEDRSADEDLEELSEIFEEIAEKTGLWTSSATFIDTRRFMPILNGTEFDKLSAGGGGVPALVNDAFYMSLLVFAARNFGASNLPGFLMLDNPFKAVGSTGSDREKIEAFGSYVGTISDTYAGRFQLLVAENDVPASLREVSEVVEFTYDSPLIPWRSHPGDPEKARPLD